MHISDGVLSPPVLIGSYVVCGSLVAYTIKRIKPEDIPKCAVMTSCFFVASLLHIPVGPTSIHLILNGLVGIILRRIAFLSIFLGVLLQTLLFQHGGVTTIGANSVIMGISALLSYRLFNFHQRFHFRLKEVIFGALAGAGGIFTGTLILAGFLITTRSKFIGLAKYAFLGHLPLMGIEGIISGFVISLLLRVKPEILGKEVVIK
jgi:cobalt/nickel transport system permease protein